MRKYIFIFSLLAVMLCSIATAFAAKEKATIIDENYNLSSIKTMAIYTPYYQSSSLSVMLNEKQRPNAPKLVTKDMLVQSAIDVALEDKMPFNLISDTEINNDISNAIGADITTLNRFEAKKAYNSNIKAFADAYVVFTFSNDSVVSMTAEIYDSSSNKLVYSYQISNGGLENDTINNYNMFMHKFFRSLTLQNQNKK